MSEEHRVEANRECLRLWRAYRTTKQMCVDRGYELLESEVNISLDEFREKYADSNGFPQRALMGITARPTDLMLQKHAIAPTPQNPNPKPAIGTIHIEFNGDDQVGMKQTKSFVQACAAQGWDNGIMVCRAAPSGAALKSLQSVLPLIIEVFREEDLLVNITMHELVPKHVLLSRDEKAALLERYRLKETQLPRIRVEDPVARYLGLRRGQVVKIIRKSETAGRYASYRWVI
ncbi:RNA polymerase Rpb5, C-terminal domain-containing protein [Cryomyces antarcticus]